MLPHTGHTCTFHSKIDPIIIRYDHNINAVRVWSKWK